MGTNRLLSNILPKDVEIENYPGVVIAKNKGCQPQNKNKCTCKYQVHVNTLLPTLFKPRQWYLLMYKYMHYTLQLSLNKCLSYHLPDILRGMIGLEGNCCSA